MSLSYETVIHLDGGADVHVKGRARDVLKKLQDDSLGDQGFWRFLETCIDGDREMFIARETVTALREVAFTR